MFDLEPCLPNPHDPFPEPARRWLRCRHLLKRRRRPSRREDVLIQLAWEYHRDWRRCRNDAERAVLARSYPDFAAAHQFWHEATPLRRAELEARLLAGEDDASIAASCDLSPEAVLFYHSLFFAVRPHLQAESYIHDKAIGLKVHDGLRCDDHAVLLKLAGYTLGAAAVDLLLAYFAAPPVWPSSLTQLDTPALETLRQKLLVRAWILSLTVPADAATAAQRPAIQHRLALACARRTAAKDAQNIFAAALDFQQFLSAPAVGVAAAPASPAADTGVGPEMGAAIAGPRDWPAVPA
jgi:hypothetical protein